MSLHQILHSELTYRIGWTLIHSLWQGALIAAALAMALVCLREKSPQLRYLAACLAMACQLLFLVGTFLRLSGSPIPVSPTDAIPKPALPAQVASVSQVKAVQIDSAIAAPSPTWTQSKKDLWQRFSKPLDTVIPWVGCMWCGGFLALSLWNLGGLIAIHRLKTRTTRSVDRILNGTLARLLTRMQMGRRVRLLQSAVVKSPLVVGVIKPIIIFPTGLLTQLSPEQVEAILIHELAHICRHDYLVNLVQVAIDTLLFYHPATWWISSRIRSERENCCDDMVIKVTRERTIYVTALAVIAESRMTLAPAASGAPLLSRIRRLLGVSDQRRQNSLVSIIILAVPLILGVMFCSERLAAQATGEKEVKTRTVVVWKVDAKSESKFASDPQASVVPDELIARAAGHNIQLKIKIFPVEGIAKVYADAKATGTGPDVLCCYNASVFESIPDHKDQCLIEESLHTLAPGWITIFRSSPNFLAAKELALTFPDSEVNEESLEATDPVLKSLAMDFAEARGEGNAQGIIRLLDPSHFKDCQGEICQGIIRLLDSSHFKDFQRDLLNVINDKFDHSIVPKKKICSVWQGEHLAVIKSMAIYESHGSIGCDTLTTIFEGEQGHWKLVDFVGKDYFDELVRGIGKLSGKRSGPTQDPVLVGPADGSSFSGRFPDSILPKLEWRHVDDNVEAYFVEAQADLDPGKGLWGTYPIKVIRPGTKGQLLDSQAPAVGAQPHRWRIWAIYGDGSVSISGWRTFSYKS